MPPARVPKPLLWCEYQPLPSVTRCLHLAEATQTYKTGRFQPRRIHSNVIADTSIKVLWFSATKSLSENNKYGNVSHIIDIDQIMERFGNNLYFIDQTVFASHTATRVVITKEDHSAMLTEVSFNNYGSPLKLNPKNSRWYHVAECQNADDPDNRHKHELELGVEVEDADLSWLYNNCVIRPNNHQMANTNCLASHYGDHCHHYNFYHSMCPTPLDESQTRRILQSKCPRIIQAEARFLAGLKK